jgi:prepilin-type N-terminal cleavage/methylation domain-containing protein
VRALRLNRKRSGFSLIELLIVIAIILIIVTIAVPKLNNARMNASETAAIGALRAIHEAEVQYYSTYGKYAATLAELGPPTSGAPSPAASDLIQEDLASGTKGGYKFVIQAAPTGYTINANPVNFGSSGRRTFYSDTSMAVHQNFGQDPAGPSSPTLQ